MRTIIAVLGVLFVLLAVKQLVNAPDPDAPPPKFMTALDTMPVGRATAFGAILALINFKQLGIYIGGIAQIVDADVSTMQQWIALVVLLIILEIGVIAPIVVFVAAREWATRQLRRFEGWLVRHNRVLGDRARVGSRDLVHCEGCYPDACDMTCHRAVSKFIDLFDGVFVLDVDLDTLNRRLDQRTENEWG